MFDTGVYKRAGGWPNDILCPVLLVLMMLLCTNGIAVRSRTEDDDDDDVGVHGPYGVGWAPNGVCDGFLVVVLTC